MPRILEKVERRLGEKLFIKGDRCLGVKCAATRRAYPPGAKRNKRARGRGGSEYAELLREKQKMRFFYGLDDGEIKGYVDQASLAAGLFSVQFIRMIERRLDVVVWRMGFSPSRRSARQLVSHGHIMVNGRAVFAPSYTVRPGQKIGLSPRAQKTFAMQRESDRSHTAAPPHWLALDKNRWEGTVAGLPEPADVGLSFDVIKIKEFYSR